MGFEGTNQARKAESREKESWEEESRELKESALTDKVFEQIMAIRDSGKTNMLLTGAVQRLAYDQGFYELVLYIEEHRKEYAHFIMYGTEG